MGPGPKARQWLERARLVYATTTVSSWFVPSSSKRAKGAVIYDEDGNRYLDFNSGVGVSNLGHGNSYIFRAREKHNRRTGRPQYIHHDFINPETIELAEDLVSAVAYSLRQTGLSERYKVFFCNSGTEANEAGFKLVRAHRPERKKFLAFGGAFHGRTPGSLSAMRKEAHIRDYSMAYEMDILTFPSRGDNSRIEQFQSDLDRLENCAREYNSVILELIQGEGGIYEFDPEALRILRYFCDRHNIYIHVDEVQTGYGRTGKFLACERYPFLNPDIITLAKGIANGHVFAAIVFKHYLDWDQPGRHSNTFGGNAENAVAARATLAYLIERKIPERAERLGKIVGEFLSELCRKYPCRVANARGLGLMRAVNFRDVFGQLSGGLRDQIVEQACRGGLLLMGAGEAAIRIMPPLVIKEKELKEGLKIFERSILEAIQNSG